MIAELVDRVNQLSLLNGLPELRSRSVVPIPSSTLLMVFGVFSALTAGVLLRRAR